jgi:hypothetical protein
MENNKGHQPHLIHPMEYMFVVAPDSDLARFIEEARRLPLREPHILELIDSDLDVHAQEKKRLRLEDRRWEDDQHAYLPSQETQRRPIDGEILALKPGRPRMSAEICYLFLMIRGYTGGIKSFDARNLFLESTSVQLVLAEAGIKMPGLSTIIENTNAISQETREAILDAQLRMILDEGIDNYKKQTVDSTAVRGNTAWPTDSSLILGFIERAWRLGLKLDKFEMPTMASEEMPDILTELKKCGYQIAMTMGRKGGSIERKVLYDTLIEHAESASQILSEELNRLTPKLEVVRIKPSRREKLVRVFQWIAEDINELDRLIEACIRRVVEEQPPTSNGRPLSLADKDAAYIKKGGHDPVIGYRVQVMRTEKGFVANLVVPQGNANDADQFSTVCEGAIARTGVIPDSISADGCYSSRANRKEFLERGVQHLSFSSSKGRAITPDEEWASVPHREARRNRSAVESLMFQLKALVHFGHVARRGLEKVTAELTEKVLAFNCLRMCRLTG